MSKPPNFYSVKLRIVPKRNHIKSAFAEGIVAAATPSQAKAVALKELAEVEFEFECTLEMYKVKKLRADFFIAGRTKPKIIT